MRAAGFLLSMVVFSGIVSSPSAFAEPQSITCGAAESALFKTETVPSSATGTTLVPIPGATASIVIPAGGERCVKLTFSAVSRCRLNGIINNVDGCFLRAAHNGLELDPKTAGAIFDNEALQNIPAARTLVWVTRLGAGKHDFAVRRRGADADTTLEILSWTLAVEVFR
jgi:hypothetical protein